VATVAGLCLWGMGGMAMWRSLDPDHQRAERNTRISQACASAAGALGKASRREDGSVDIEFAEVSDARGTLGDMTSVYAMCPFQAPTHACIGVRCGSKPSSTPVATLRLGPPRF
jgi:hypothetical protein